MLINNGEKNINKQKSSQTVLVYFHSLDSTKILAG